MTEGDVYRMEICRRCGKEFESLEPQGVCNECLYLDWHESDNELEEGDDSVPLPTTLRLKL